jgi:putative ABC transport system substrate-binding protein
MPRRRDGSHREAGCTQTFPRERTSRENELQRAKAAAQALGLDLEILNATSSSEIERALDAAPPGRFDALAVGADAFFINRRDRIVALAAARRLPAIFLARADEVIE